MQQFFLKNRYLIAGIILLCHATPGFSSTAVHDVVLINTTALFDRATLIANSTGTATNPLDEINLSLSTMGQDITVVLRPSSLNALAKRHSNSDRPTVYFEGSVAGDDASWARLSVKDQKLNGHIFYLNTFYQLEHKDYLASLSLAHTGNSDHVILQPGASDDGRQLLEGFLPQADYIKFAPTDTLRNKTTFGSLLDQIKIGTTESAQQDSASVEALPAYSGLKMDTEALNVTRSLRAGIYVDSRFNEAHQQRGLSRALTIMSAVDAIYQSQLGIAVIVDSVEVHEDAMTDPMREQGGTVAEILDNFREVRMQSTNLPSDLSVVHLFTGHRDPKRVIGLGWKSTLCRLDGYDISVSTPFPFDTLLAAHELAHNLGAVHDGDPQCEIEDGAQNNTLMWPEISSASTSTFSSCSLMAMQEAKSRSCNLDNIDAAIDIRTYPSNDVLSRSVVVEVSNNDALGRTTELFSTTQFPAGTQFEGIAAGCVLSGTSVECNHGRVRAATTSSISLTATLPNTLTENVVSSVELVNASDTYDSDNRKAILLLQSIDATDQLFATDLSAMGDDQSVTTGDFVTGVGKPSHWLLLVLSLMAGIRRSRYWLSIGSVKTSTSR